MQRTADLAAALVDRWPRLRPEPRAAWHWLRAEAQRRGGPIEVRYAELAIAWKCDAASAWRRVASLVKQGLIGVTKLDPGIEIRVILPSVEDLPAPRPKRWRARGAKDPQKELPFGADESGNLRIFNGDQDDKEPHAVAVQGKEPHAVAVQGKEPHAVQGKEPHAVAVQGKEPQPPRRDGPDAHARTRAMESIERDISLPPSLHRYHGNHGNHGNHGGDEPANQRRHPDWSTVAAQCDRMPGSWFPKEQLAESIEEEMTITVHREDWTTDEAQAHLVHIMQRFVQDAATDETIFRRMADLVIADDRLAGPLAHLLTDLLGVRRSPKGFTSPSGTAGPLFLTGCRNLARMADKTWKKNSR